VALGIASVTSQSLFCGSLGFAFVIAFCILKCVMADGIVLPLLTTHTDFTDLPASNYLPIIALLPLFCPLVCLFARRVFFIGFLRLVQERCKISCYSCAVGLMRP